ncbi:hypothetical protein HDU98_011471, partial [Podochytrium sp. JEL0797]
MSNSTGTAPSDSFTVIAVIVSTTLGGITIGICLCGTVLMSLQLNPMKAAAPRLITWVNFCLI